MDEEQLKNGWEAASLHIFKNLICFYLGGLYILLILIFTHQQSHYSDINPVSNGNYLRDSNHLGIGSKQAIRQTGISSSDYWNLGYWNSNLLDVDAGL